jgi:hypothetical protein
MHSQYDVMLNEVKHLGSRATWCEENEILRFAQDDNVVARDDNVATRI